MPVALREKKAVDLPLEERIRRRAYELYVQRGGVGARVARRDRGSGRLTGLARVAGHAGCGIDRLRVAVEGNGGGTAAA